MSQTTACLLSRSNELKKEKRCFKKIFTIFGWHNSSREHFKISLGNMGTKDNLMTEKGDKELPYTILSVSISKSFQLQYHS